MQPRALTPCRAVSIALTLMVTALPTARAETVRIRPVKDNTLYESATGARSNGRGDYLFVGRTFGPSLRRGLIAFDIAGNVPEGATIDAVRLRLRMSRTRAGERTITLHRVLADWGEGSSDASGQEGRGDAAQPNDATWLHRFFNTVFWENAGGDYSEIESASQSVGGPGPYTWSSPQLTADVQSMLDDPANNFGWILLGPENVQSAKRFNSRQHSTRSSQPRLIVDFTPAPVDTTPPQIAVELNHTTLWPPNHELVEIVASVSVTDDVDPAPTFVLTSVASDEPDNGQGDGKTNSDIQDVAPGTPDTMFKLRAERSGKGDGRTYTIVYTATDEAGNVASTRLDVRVPHDLSGGSSDLPGAGRGDDGPQRAGHAAATEPSITVFPNPFNPATTIAFTLPSPERVVLDIYDIDGALVRRLAAGMLPSGPHRIVWDSRDDHGRAVATGIYVMRIQAGTLSTTRKLLLLK